MNLRDYFRVLRRGWWIIAVLAILGAAAGAVVSYLSPLSYRSTATVFVSVGGATTPNDLQVGNVFGMQRVESYAALVGTASVLSRVAAAVDGPVTVSELQRAITSNARDQTVIIDITAASDNADRAAEWANAAAAALAQEVRRLEGGGVASSSPVDVSTVQAAEVPLVALSPQPRYNVLVGGVVGLVLGLALVVTLNAFDTRVRTLGDLPRVTGLATLTSIPSARVRGRRGTAGDRRREAFRTLRANLQFGARMRGSIAVAAASPSVASHAFTADLADALAEIGSRVAILDLDLRPDGDRSRARRRGAFAEALPGVADLLAGRAALDDVLPTRLGDTVAVIGAGAVDEDSSQRLSTEALSELLAVLNARFDYVLLACPPITERSESVVAAAHAGRSLVLLESGLSTRSDFLRSLELLAGVGVRSVSVAIDGVTDLEPSPDRAPGAEGGVALSRTGTRPAD